MFKKTVRKIHDLRIFLFSFIVVSFLFSVGINPIDIGKFIGAKFSGAAGVDMNASIQPNSFNTLAMQLKEKETRLKQKEDEIAEREARLHSSQNLLQNQLILFMIGGIIVLFFLIVLNYFLDWKRRKAYIMSLKKNSNNSV